ncbi:unnamed protein product [Caenorhabditis nigoni]
MIPKVLVSHGPKKENFLGQFFEGPGTLNGVLNYLLDTQCLKVANKIEKKFLSSQCPYFAALFLGQFEESGKPEIELKDVYPRDLQYYLEVLYGEPGIDEETVERILTIADMYDTPVVDKKCKTFLMKHPDLKLKLKMAGKFGLEELKKSCMDQLKSKKDIRSVIPEDPSDMDYEILVELLKKSLDLEK